jgi:hypothetical protein
MAIEQAPCLFNRKSFDRFLLKEVRAGEQL